MQVEPLFARQLFLLCQQSNTNHRRPHELTVPLLWDQLPTPQQDYPTNSSHQLHGNALQDWPLSTQSAEQDSLKRESEPTEYRTRLIS